MSFEDFMALFVVPLLLMIGFISIRISINRRRQKAVDCAIEESPSPLPPEAPIYDCPMCGKHDEVHPFARNPLGCPRADCGEAR